MIINNEKEIIAIKLRRLFLAILATIIIVALFTTKLAETEFLGLTNKIWAIITAIIFLIYFIYQQILEPYYLSLIKNENILIFNYYPSAGFSHQKQTIQIPIIQFYKYEIKQGFFKKKEKLIIYQNTGKGIFKYPPICLSALNKKEKELLKNFLIIVMKKQQKA